MAFVKKYMFWIILGAAMLVAVGVFVPAVLLGAKNVKELSTVQSQCAAVYKLQPVPQSAVEQWKGNLARVKEDLNQIVQLAYRSSSRPLIEKAGNDITIKIFPQPTSTPQLYYQKFGAYYASYIDELITRANGKDCPSAMEVEQRLQKTNRRGGEMPAGMGGMDMGGMGGMGGGFGIPGTGQKSAQQKIVDELYQERSKQISIYMSPLAFCGYEYWKSHDGNGNRETLMKESWFTQLAYWISEDVVLSITSMNRKEANVQQNPVKRLIEVSFSGAALAKTGSAGATGMGDAGGGGGMMMGGMTGMMSGGDTPAAGRRVSVLRLPAYVLNTPAGGSNTMGSAFGASSASLPDGGMVTAWTGRKGDALFDVVHFEVAAIVDSTKVMDFMLALQSEKGQNLENRRNQITILGYDITPVNSAADNAAGYYYGQGFQSEVRLKCEYVFFRGGYESVMPEPVKAMAQSAAAPSAVGSPF